MFQFKYTKNAVKDLQSFDIQIAKQILKKMDFFSKQENPLKFAKKLKDYSLGEYRFRIGNYRVIFDVDDKKNIKILTILSVKHRKDAYLS